MFVAKEVKSLHPFFTYPTTSTSATWWRVSTHKYVVSENPTAYWIPKPLIVLDKQFYCCCLGLVDFVEFSKNHCNFRSLREMLRSSDPRISGWINHINPEATFRATEECLWPHGDNDLVHTLPASEWWSSCADWWPNCRHFGKKKTQVLGEPRDDGNRWK